MKRKKFNWLIIFPIVAVISICVYSYVNFLPLNESERKPVEVFEKSGEKPDNLNTLDDFSQNITANDGMPNSISVDDTAVIDNQNQAVKSFCGNKNSKIYHSLGCTYSKNMKDENKVYFSTKDECIANGYKPCSRCKP